MAVDVADELQRRDCGLYREHGLEGGEVGVLKCYQELITECGVDVTTIVVLTTLICVLPDDFLLVKGGCTR